MAMPYVDWDREPMVPTGERLTLRRGHRFTVATVTLRMPGRWEAEAAANACERRSTIQRARWCAGCARRLRTGNPPVQRARRQAAEIASPTSTGYLCVRCWEATNGAA